jgi:hypothetical protein
MPTTDTFLGRLGNREGINVAKVEVSWYYEGDVGNDRVEHGFYIVHAVGDEPEITAEGEDGTIYAVFEGRVHAAMQERQERLGFAGYEIDDISAI